jgi:uncharacterized Zn finger protein (UPF0148 family)
MAKCKCTYFNVDEQGALRCTSCGRLSQSEKYQQPDGAPEYPEKEPETKTTEKPEDKASKKPEDKAIKKATK